MNSRRSSVVVLVSATLLAAPVVPAPAGAPTAAAVAQVPLAGLRPQVQPLPDGGVLETRTVSPDDPFSLLGVTWDADADLQGSSVEVRVLEAGEWGGWQELEVEDAGPDPGTAEAAGARTGTAPLVVTDGTRVEVRVERAPGESVAGTDLVLVQPGEPDAESVPLATAGAAPVAQPHVYTRPNWGARAPQCGIEYASTAKAVTIHHTASANDYTSGQVAGLLNGFQSYHMSMGWCDIGYNALVDRFGRVWEGRSGGLHRSVVGAHAGGFNAGSFGIAVIGDYTAAEPTSVSLEAVSGLVAWRLGNTYRDPRGTVQMTSAGGGTSKYAEGRVVTLPTVFAHRDVGSTACPGANVYRWMDAIRGRAAQLVGDPSTPIRRGWEARGGEAGALGSPVSAESPVVGGRNAGFHRGDVVAGAGGVFAVKNGIRARYHELGGSAGHLRMPAGDEVAEPGGASQRFDGGWSVAYWSPATGTKVVRGGIRARYQQLGGPAGRLGYPTTDETTVPARPDAAWTRFSGGDVVWSPGSGARAVVGGIRTAWLRTGGAAAQGVPVDEESVVAPGVVRQRFSTAGATALWSEGTGAHLLRGAILATWNGRGGTQSDLGLPTSDEYATGWGARTEFEHGAIEWHAATGVVTVVRR